MMASDATRDYWAIAAYIMTALTLILFFVVIALSNSVKISSAVMKEASNAINKIPSLLSYGLCSFMSVVSPFLLPVLMLVCSWSFFTLIP